MPRLACCSIALSVLAACASLPEWRAADATAWPSPGCPEAIRSSAQRLLDEAVGRHRLVGVQVAFLRPGGPRCLLASGTTRPERDEPLRPDHVVRLGSLTKTYTAVLVLRLAERGLLDLDAPLGRWFPGRPASERVSVRMLLDHSSGIPELLGPRTMLLSTWSSRRVWTDGELEHMALDPDLAFEPGSDHRYSNSNYVLLGLIAQRVTGRPLASLLREEILGPLHLESTAYLPAEATPPRLVAGFDRDLIPLPGWHVTTPENTSWSSLAVASGAMAASAGDVARFFEAVVGREVVSEASYRRMVSFETARHPQDRYLERFGSGLFAFGPYYGDAYGHPGLFVGSEALALFDPEERWVFVLLANVSRIRERDVLVEDLLATFAGGRRGQE